MMVNVYTALNNLRVAQSTTASGPASSTPTPAGRNWNFFGRSSSSGDISGIIQRLQSGKVGRINNSILMVPLEQRMDQVSGQ